MEQLVVTTQSQLLELIKEGVRSVISEMPAISTQGQREPSGTKKQAAAYLKVSVSTLDTLTATGQVKSFRIGKRVMYRYADLDAYINSK